MTVGVSPVIQVVTETEYRCMNCGYSSTITHSRPLFSIPQYLSTTAGRARQCLQCEKHSFAPFDHKEMSAMVIQLQDDKKQNDLETLTVVLFDNDTLNVKNGEKVIVKGSLHVVQQKNNGKRMTFLFTEVNSGIQKEESQTDEETPLTEQDIAKLNEYSKRPDYIKEITAMFAPTVIGHEDKKLGVILMYVGAPENQDFRGRIHGLFIGPPGLAKTKLEKRIENLIAMLLWYMIQEMQRVLK